MTLYSISQDLMQLLAMAEEGELDSDVIADTLEAVEGEYTDKLDAYATIIKKLEADVEMVEAEIDRLKETKERLIKNITGMKDSVMCSMIDTGHRKVQGEHFTWQIQRNGGKRPITITKDLMEIPPEYKKVRYEVDKDSIRKVLESGVDLPFAQLEERGESLRLK